MLAIVNLLLQEERLSFTEIRERLRSQSLKNHLVKLAEGNIVERRLTGTGRREYRSFYQISEYGLRLIVDILMAFHDMEYDAPPGPWK